ncbi:DUF1707 SHOCT-like domain-containing protein [Micromonospora sp. CPCC 206061]|uniref:DUF1707 SHOCT-like domain-containing protein n=1 Tax=Micromonospora sp. CPCC 206061 TaxID=3122410 RepID=UPI002FF33FC1
MSETADARRLRASDAEREQMAQILRAAMTEGRLDLAEGEQRLTTAYAATYRDELAVLTTDLPDGGRRALAETPEARAHLRREAGRRFSGFVVVAAVLVGLWVLSGASFFWPAIPLVFIFVGMMKHRHYHHSHRGRAWHGPPWR